MAPPFHLEPQKIQTMTTTFQAFPLALAGLAALLGQPAAQAATHVAAAEMTSTNPSGVWQYGRDDHLTPGYDFVAFDHFDDGPAGHGWNTPGYQSLGAPGIWINTAGATQYGVAHGQLSLHPGPDGGSASGDAAILRFTAPSSASWQVSAQFLSGDGGATDAWVVLNGQFGTPLASLGSTGLGVAFHQVVQMQAGDTLDFAVGNAGSFFGDNTPLVLTVSTVPEPGSAVLLLAGLLGLARRQSRRR